MFKYTNGSGTMNLYVAKPTTDGEKTSVWAIQDGGKDNC